MLKDLVAKRANLHSQMTALLDKARAENRSLSAEEDQKFDAIDADILALDAEISREEKYEKHRAAMNRLTPMQFENINAGANQEAAEETNTGSKRYKEVFTKHFKFGPQALSGEELSILRMGYRNVDGGPQAALSPATGTTGGYLIPTGFENTLAEARKWFGGIDQFSDTITTDTGNPLPFPTANDTTNTGEIVGANVAVSQAYPGFGSVLLSAYKFSSKLVLVPIELLQDSAFDLNTWIPKQLGTRLARIQNTKFTIGTGSSEPTGIVTAAAAAGIVITMAAGNTATVSVDNAYDLEFAVDKAYRSGSRYMLSDTTLKLYKKLKDTTGRPLWQPGLSATFAVGAPSTINGYEYVINNDMPNPGASNYIMAFGDYMNFKIRRVNGYIVLRLAERYAEYGQVGFLCFERADSNLIDAGTHPVALLQNSAT